MEVIHGLANLKPHEKPSAVTIGVFDGVHLGHRAIIKRCIEKAKSIGGCSVVITFDPMPEEVLTPGRAPARITTLDQKIRLIDRLGVDELIVLAFEPSFAEMKPESFARPLLSTAMDARAIVVGRDFRFGRDRQGDAGLLRRIFEGEGVDVEAVDLLEVGGEPVSSTRIRSLLQSGEVEEARALLGRYPVVAGRVVSGLRRGRMLGFPSANVAVENPGSLPAPGVYAGKAEVRGADYRALVYVGESPTFGDVGTVECHVHLLDYDGRELYEENIEVEITKRVRGDIKFGGAEQLKAQIERDISEAYPGHSE